MEAGNKGEVLHRVDNIASQVRLKRLGSDEEEIAVSVLGRRGRDGATAATADVEQDGRHEK